MRRTGMTAVCGLFALAGCSKGDAFTLYNNTGQDVRLVVQNQWVVEKLHGARGTGGDREIVIRAGTAMELRETLREWSAVPRVPVKAVFGGCAYTYDPLALAAGLRHYAGEPGVEISIRLEADGRVVKLSPRARVDPDGRIQKLSPRAETAQDVAPVQAGGFPIEPLNRVCG